jgi:hypothetical protein
MQGAVAGDAGGTIELFSRILPNGWADEMVVFVQSEKTDLTKVNLWLVVPVVLTMSATGESRLVALNFLSIPLLFSTTYLGHVHLIMRKADEFIAVRWADYPSYEHLSQPPCEFISSLTDLGMDGKN